MPVLLALVAALTYGASDFAGGLVSRRTAPWAVAFVALGSGSVALLALAAATGGDPGPGDLAWGAVAGLGSGVGSAFLYRGLATGRMGVVAPLSGVGAAVLPVVVATLLGERPGPVVTTGLLLALPGIALVSSEPRTTTRSSPGDRPPGDRPPGDRPPGSAGRRLPDGVLDGVLAGLGFGVLFAALAQVPAGAGLLPLALHQVVATGVVSVLALALSQPFRPDRTALLGGIVPGLLAAAATAAYLVAAQGGLLSVTAVLTALYPAVTVLLALVVLAERTHAAQRWGLVLCGVAVGLVAAG